jgi:hypothetical protein
MSSSSHSILASIAAACCALHPAGPQAAVFRLEGGAGTHAASAWCVCVCAGHCAVHPAGRHVWHHVCAGHRRSSGWKCVQSVADMRTSSAWCVGVAATLRAVCCCAQGIVGVRFKRLIMDDTGLVPKSRAPRPPQESDYKRVVFCSGKVCGCDGVMV